MTGSNDTMPPTRLCAECGTPMTGTSCTFGTITPLHRACLDIVEQRSLLRLSPKQRREVSRGWFGTWIGNLFRGGGPS